MKNKRLVAAMLITLGGVLPAQGTVLSGRFGVSTYIWERSEPDFTDTRHFQNTGTMNLRLARIADQNLEITTSLRGRYDVRNVGSNADSYHIYNLRARWKDIGGVVDLTGGRQRVYWPTGSVAIDGGAAAARLGKGLRVSGYFGVTAPEDGRFKTTDYDNGHALGVQVQHRSRLGRVSISFAQRNRAQSYGTTNVNNLASQILGLDWRRVFRGFGSLYGNLVYAIPTQRIDRAHVSVRWRATDALAVNGQFRYRRPSIAYNSVFWVFGNSRYYEGRLRVNYRLNQTWSVTVGGAYVDLINGHTERYDLGLVHRYFTLTLNGKGGYSGTTVGLSGQALYPINERWTVRAGSRFSSYELLEDAPDANFETSSWAGVQWRWMEQSTIDIEGQFVAQNIKTEPNLFTGENRDFRLIARVSWWFFNRLSGQPRQYSLSNGK